MVGTNVTLSVLTSMAFFKWKGLNKLTESQVNVDVISIKVGKKVGSSYVEKQNAFDKITFPLFDSRVTFTIPEPIDDNKANNRKNIKWQDPVMNPISTIFTQTQTNGVINFAGKHWGLFGKTRNGSIHQGLDLFIKPKQNVFACVKAEVFEIKQHSGYGNTLTLKVIDKESFLLSRRNYVLKYPQQGELNQDELFNKKDDIFLFYAHLHKVLVKKGDIISDLKIPIAESGVSGIKKGTCAPHLHFEIFTTVYAVGLGLKYRCNPRFYVNFKNYDEQSVEEIELQIKTAKNGLITE